MYKGINDFETTSNTSLLESERAKIETNIKTKSYLLIFTAICKCYAEHKNGIIWMIKQLIYFNLIFHEGPETFPTH